MTSKRLERFAHNLDWNLLRTFAVVVEEGSITAAANRLLLQQPARPAAGHPALQLQAPPALIWAGALLPLAILVRRAGAAAGAGASDSAIATMAIFCGRAGARFVVEPQPRYRDIQADRWPVTVAPPEPLWPGKFRPTFFTWRHLADNWS